MRLAVGAIAAASLFFLTHASPAFSQWLPLQGEGTLRLTYEQQRGGDHLFSSDAVDGQTSRGYTASGDRWFLGRTSGYTLMVEADYGWTDRIATEASIAFVATKYEGRAPLGTLDDGNIHGTFQDFGIDVSYLLLERMVVIIPSLGATLPVTRYERDSHAAPGRRLREARVGVDAGLPVVMRTFGVQFGVRHAFLEDIGPLDLSRNEVSATVSLRLGGRALAAIGANHQRVIGGLDWIPEEGDPDLHDPAASDVDLAGSASRITRGTFSLTWLLGHRTDVQVGWLPTLDGENTEDADLFTLSLRRGFGDSGG